MKINSNYITFIFFIFFLNTTESAELLNRRGDIVRLSKSGEKWENINKKIIVENEDTFKTLQNGFSELKIDDFNVIRLSANTKVKYLKDTETKIIIEIFKGRIWLKKKK